MFCGRIEQVALKTQADERNKKIMGVIKGIVTVVYVLVCIALTVIVLM